MYYIYICVQYTIKISNSYPDYLEEISHEPSNQWEFQDPKMEVT